MTPAIFVLVASLALLPLNGLAVFDKPSTSDTLLEIGVSQKQTKNPPANGQLKILSYNIRWRSGDDLKKLISLFRDDPEIGKATLIGLQEVDRQKKRSGKTNVAKFIAEELGMHYAWAAPPVPQLDDEEETGVAIFSAYPMSDVERIVLPNEGPGHRRRVALGATIKVGETLLRFYTVHAETRIGVDKKNEQMDALLKNLSQYPQQMPAIILGDLNTWQLNAESRIERLFTTAGFHTPFQSQSTFQRRVLFVPIDLRLDWVWLRNIEAVNHGIDRKITVSDHWPLWTDVKLLPAKKPKL